MGRFGSSPPVRSRSRDGGYRRNLAVGDGPHDGAAAGVARAFVQEGRDPQSGRQGRRISALRNALSLELIRSRAGDHQTLEDERRRPRSDDCRGLGYERAWGKPKEYDPASEKPVEPEFNPRDYSPEQLDVIEAALRLMPDPPKRQPQEPEVIEPDSAALLDEQARLPFCETRRPSAAAHRGRAGPPPWLDGEVEQLREVGSIHARTSNTMTTGCRRVRPNRAVGLAGFGGSRLFALSSLSMTVIPCSRSIAIVSWIRVRAARSVFVDGLFMKWRPPDLEANYGDGYGRQSHRRSGK
jgi:hypothetical protein